MRTDGESEMENREMDGDKKKRGKHSFNTGASCVFVHEEVISQVRCVFAGLKTFAFYRRYH